MKNEIPKFAIKIITGKTQDSKILFTMTPDINKFKTFINNNKRGIEKLLKIYECILEQDKYFICFKNGKCGICSFSGKELLPCVYDEIYIYKDYAEVKKDEKMGIYSFNTKTFIISLEFEIASLESVGGITVKKDGFCGVYDMKGNIVIPIEYEEIWAGDKKEKGYIALKNEIYIVFDFNGNKLNEFTKKNEAYECMRKISKK